MPSLWKLSCFGLQITSQRWHVVCLLCHSRLCRSSEALGTPKTTRLTKLCRHLSEAKTAASSVRCAFYEFLHFGASLSHDFCVRLENPPCTVALLRLLFIFFPVALLYYEISLLTLTALRDKVHQVTGVPVVGDRLVLPDVLEYFPLG